MLDAKAFMDQFLTSNAAGGQTEPGNTSFSLDKLLTGYGGLATGAAAGGLAGLLLGGGKPKKIAETALKVGGVALVGGLAYKAYQNWQANKTATSAASATSVPQVKKLDETAFLPDTEDEREALARKLVRAMIAGTKADGTITDKERAEILTHLQAIQLDDNDRQFVERELAAPLDISAVVKSAETPQEAIEIYTASLLAIDANGRAERGYLALLAAKLDLEPGLVEHIHANMQAETEKAAA